MSPLKNYPVCKKKTIRESQENISIFELYGKKQLQWCEENDFSLVSAWFGYFSDRVDINVDAMGYEWYCLYVGEEKTYQIGYFWKKNLQYRSYAYQDDTIFPIDYKFTAEKIQIFDNYQEAELPKEEFMEDYVTDQPFVLLDLTIKKTSGHTQEEVSYWDTIELLKLVNRKMQEAAKNTLLFLSPTILVAIPMNGISPTGWNRESKRSIR